MPPVRQTQHTAHSNRHTDNLFQLAQIHGGRLSRNTTRPQPYVRRIPTAHAHLPRQNLTLPTNLLEKISQVEGAAVNKTTQAKDASRLREFLTFCQGLGIQSNNALPAREDILMAWASSYAGRLAGRTVGAKILAIRKEHQRRGLAWQGGERLRLILKGVEEMRPASSFYSKRAPVMIAMLDDLNSWLDRSSGLDNCVRAICCLSFFSQLRIGEILPPTQNLRRFNPRRHATFAHIQESTAKNGACNLHLPWSKTQKA
jgi:hypothetical protein